MKCYNHHDRDAFAVCKSCGKALCLECAEEYKNTFICKGSKACRHVADVEFVTILKIIQKVHGDLTELHLCLLVHFCFCIFLLSHLCSS